MSHTFWKCVTQKCVTHLWISVSHIFKNVYLCRILCIWAANLNINQWYYNILVFRNYTISDILRNLYIGWHICICMTHLKMCHTRFENVSPKNVSHRLRSHLLSYNLAVSAHRRRLTRLKRFILYKTPSCFSETTPSHCEPGKVLLDRLSAPSILYCWR